MKPKALILQAHGSNRDLDVIEALTLAGADAAGIPLNELRERREGSNRLIFFFFFNLLWFVVLFFCFEIFRKAGFLL